MRLLLITIIVFFSSYKSTAQKIRLTDTTNDWRYLNIATDSSSIGHTMFSWNSTTIYDSTEYLDLYVAFLIREDTVANKVYVRRYSYLLNDYEPFERVLYDYNRQLGDTVIIDILNEHYGHVITAIDSVLINNIWHKVWHFTNFEYSNLFENGAFSPDYDVIEGIGSLYGRPSFPIQPKIWHSTPILNCFYTHGTQYSLDHAVGIHAFDNLQSCLLNAGNITAGSKLIVSVAPNPITDQSNITFSRPLESGELIIFDCIGKRIFSVHLDNATLYPLAAKLPSIGIYYYQIIDNKTGHIYRGTISF